MMRDCLPITTKPKTMKQIQVFHSIDQATQRFSDGSEEKWRQRVTLPQTPLRFEKMQRGPLDQDGKRSGRNTLLISTSPSLTKPEPSEHIINKTPLDVIISF